jgi:hypothetical protein
VDLCAIPLEFQEGTGIIARRDIGTRFPRLAQAR